MSMHDLFAYFLQGRRIDVGMLGGAQVDRWGNLNTTVIGPYDHPPFGSRARAEPARSPSTPGGWSSS